MPIKIPDTLPARGVLEGENIFVMTSSRALSQDIRPLKLIILNLMPKKEITETQLLRCLSNTPLQIEVEFLKTSTYTPKNTDPSHLTMFYTTFSEIKDKWYDGMIITGAPVEQLPFEEVAYWEELCHIMEWSKSRVTSTFHICWGAQAALYYHYNIPKKPFRKKRFGVYRHEVTAPFCPLTRGFNDDFRAPHSRHTSVWRSDICKETDLAVIVEAAKGEDKQPYIIMSKDGRMIFVMGHLEYDAETLKDEYERDKQKKNDVDEPKHYSYQKPSNEWRSHGYLLYSNWLNYYVYQTTPYDLVNS